MRLYRTGSQWAFWRWSLVASRPSIVWTGPQFKEIKGKPESLPPLTLPEFNDLKAKFTTDNDGGHTIRRLIATVELFHRTENEILAENDALRFSMNVKAGEERRLADMTARIGKIKAAVKQANARINEALHSPAMMGDQDINSICDAKEILDEALKD